MQNIIPLLEPRNNSQLHNGSIKNYALINFVFIVSVVAYMHTYVYARLSLLNGLLLLLLFAGFLVTKTDEERK